MAEALELASAYYLGSGKEWTWEQTRVKAWALKLAKSSEAATGAALVQGSGAQWANR